MPSAGGDTLFSNQYLAYDRLSEPVKEMVSGLTAIHTAANYGSPDMKAEPPVVRRVTILGDHPEPAFDAQRWRPYEYESESRKYKQRFPHRR
jgi:alpha-ketoglutarate-dependent taurine dioxygenase